MRMRLLRSMLLGLVAVGLPVIAEAASKNWTQENYRWRNDNGSQSAATWKDAENTPITGVAREQNIRLRFVVTSTSDAGSQVSNYFGIAYSEGSTNGPWIPVDASLEGSPLFVMRPTSGYADGDPTTRQMDSGISSTFTPGKCVEAPSSVSLVSMQSARYCNMEDCIWPTGWANRNTPYYFIVQGWTVDQGTGLLMPSDMAILQAAQLTIEDAEYTAPPTIVSSLATQNADGGLPWSYSIYATGAKPAGFQAQGLPAGITLSGYVLSGRPTEYGTFNVTLTVTNAYGTDSQVLPLVVSEPAAELIVDDSDMGLQGWSESATSTQAWNSTCLVSSWGGAEQIEAYMNPYYRWTPDVPLTAEYDVYARWTYTETRGRNVAYATHHAGGTSEVFVNQRNPALSAQWNLLGRYTFNQGTNGYIELSGLDGQACADAIRLVRVGGVPAPDADGDGMLDEWENTYLGGTNASPTADADSDGMSNLQEFLAGTIPNDPDSVLAVVGLTGTGDTLDLKWPSVAGRTYGIDKSTNLMEGFTLTEAAGITADPPTNSYPVTVGTGGIGFYRVSVE